VEALANDLCELQRNAVSPIAPGVVPKNKFGMHR